MNINLNIKDDVANIIRAALVVEPIDSAMITPMEVPMTTLPKAVLNDFNGVVDAACANKDFVNAQEAMGFKGFVTFEVGSVHMLFVRTVGFDVLMAVHGRSNIEHIKCLINRGRTIVVLRDKQSASLEAIGFKAEMLDGDPVYIWRP
ncbi:MAG: hypothetical protein ACRDBQ_18195 [Shewanella sp.]